MSLLGRAALACTLGLCLFRSATAGELSTKPIRITQGGTAEKPAVFDGKGLVIDLENIRALSNCDEGISAHDDVQMDVDGAEIAWNGSSVGGVADVDRSITTYKNCQVHDNVGGAFKFFGKSHSVTDTVIYNQNVDFTLGKETKFRQERVDNKVRPTARGE